MARARLLSVCAVVLLAVSACQSQIAPSPTPSSAEAVLVGAGDIATCASSADSETAALLEKVPGGVFTLGDNAYTNGTRQEFEQCYGETWGKVRDRTRPVIGNHEYNTAGAHGYFDYFGAAAGPRGEGWYSYDAGTWHVVVLNSNCDVVPGGCGTGSAQERWLRADLASAAGRTRCTVAMWHHPLFTSSAVHGPTTAVRPLFKDLYDAGVEVLLTGHNHQYERFAPQTPDGARDDAAGIREFVVGTGGAGLYKFQTPAPNSEVRLNGANGVLRLTLTDGAYDWRFLPVGSAPGDTGHGTCH